MYEPSNLLVQFGGMFLLLVAASTVWFTILKVLHHYKQKVQRLARRSHKEIE